jgi:hypothetical protein
MDMAPSCTELVPLHSSVPKYIWLSHKSVAEEQKLQIKGKFWY